MPGVRRYYDADEMDEYLSERVLPVLRRVRAVVPPGGWSETHLDELIKELEGEND